MARAKKPRNPNLPHDRDANRDPLSGAPGAHPVGVGAGAATAGATGAAIGAAAAGPVGAAVGAAVGGVAGALAGKGMAEAVNPTVEDEYWRAHYDTRPYVSPGTKYDEYRPAFQYGWESYARYQGRRFDDVEVELRRDWESRPAAPLGWERVRMAARDAWQRVEGDAPRDGEKRRP